MKKLQIIENCLVPSGKPGEMKTAFVGSVIAVDDAVASQVVAGGRARFADDAAKEVDTTPKAGKGDKDSQ